MSNDAFTTPWASAPYRFLEDGRTEEPFNIGRPLTIADAADNDIANVFSRDDSTIHITRETAIATARLFEASPKLAVMLYLICKHPADDKLRGEARALLSHIGIYP